MAQEVSEDSLMVAGGPRRRGRPKAAEQGSTLSIWLPSSDHEFYVKLAERRGETISATVRQLLRVKWKHSKDLGVK